MNNTALRAKAQSADSTHMVFANEKHEKFHNEKLVENTWNEVVDFFEKLRSMFLEDNFILPETNQIEKYANRLLEFILSIYTRNPYNMARSIERVKKKDNVEIDDITARVLFEEMQLLYLKGERKLLHCWSDIYLCQISTVVTHLTSYYVFITIDVLNLPRFAAFCPEYDKFKILWTKKESSANRGKTGKNTAFQENFHL